MTALIHVTSRIVTTLLLLASFIFGGAASANAATVYHASPTGRGTTCTATAPCSLATGLKKLRAGDTLYLRGGTYRQVVSFDRSGTSESNRITIAGYPGEKAVIDGSGITLSSCYTYLVTMRGSYVTLRDLTVTNSYGSGIYLGGTRTDITNVTLANTGESGLVLQGTDNIADGVTVTGNGNRYGSGCSTWGAAINPKGLRTTIRNSLAYNNRGEGISANKGAVGAVIEDNIAYDNASLGIYLNSSTGATVQRNLVYYTPNNLWGKASSCIVIGNENAIAPTGITIANNMTVGCWLSLMTDSNVTALSDTTIVHNTFANTTKTAADITAGYKMNVYFRPSLATFTNSVFANNIILEEDTRQVPISLPATHPGLTLTHNLWSKTPTTAAQGTGDITANPLLTRTGTIAPATLTPDWFRLTPTSPAINHATPTTITEDYFRTTRTTPDIGAHEHERTNTAPTLSGVVDATITEGDAFDPAVGVTATDAEDGDLTTTITITGTANTTTPGTYPLTYTVTDSGGLTATATRTITVEEAPNTPPTLSGVLDATITEGDAFDPAVGVTATDAEDGDLTTTITITGTANTTTPGTYPLTYTVTDSGGLTATATRTITVEASTAPPVEEGALVVSPTGTGTACSTSNPCSLSTGLGLVGAGDTLYLRGGTYRQVVSFDRSGTSESNRITIAGYPGEKAVIDGSGITLSSCYTYLVTMRGSYVTLRDLTVTNSYGSGIYLGGTRTDITNVTLANTGESGLVLQGTDNIADGVTVTGNGNRYGSGCSTWGAAINPKGLRTTIRNSLAYNNRGEGISANKGAVGAVIEDNIAYDNASLGIYLNSSTGATVQRNLVYYTPNNLWGKASSCIVIGNENAIAPTGITIANNMTVGCWLSLMTDSNVTALSDTTIVHNTFANTTKTAADITAGYKMNVYFRPSLATFTNSVFANNIILEEDTRQVPISLPATHPGLTLTHNLWSKTPTTAAQGTGGITANPLLTRTGTIAPATLTPDWFRLTPTSPAINHATPTTITEDYFRTTRTTPDIGAHELS